MLIMVGPTDQAREDDLDAVKINIEESRGIRMCEDMDVATVDCSDPVGNRQVEVESWNGAAGLVPAAVGRLLRRGVALRLGLRRPVKEEFEWLVSADPALGEAHWFRRTPDGRLISEVRRMPVRRVFGNEPVVRCRVFPGLAGLRGRCWGCDSCPLVSP